ncbi:chromate efflux transporter [Nocardia carnea]|uniref:chromate efflux transporter n=1 Tax=Nocardia carnea TaxID=37328 RepID=UPI0024584A28|nr:chromate efflux transporter [Nocardia carnea]
MDSAGEGERPVLRRDTATDLIPLRTATKAWFLISLQTFGGPAGQIAVMQRTLVEEKRWIGQQRFLHALNYCMLLPGPEAQQLAIYIGWLLNGRRGGLIAGTLFVLPGMLALLALSAIYVGFGDTTLLAGLAPAVVVIVAQAVLRVGRRALTRPGLVAIAVAAFAALTLFAVPFPVVIAVAAVAGWVLGRTNRSAPADHDEPGTAESVPLIADDALHHETPSARRGLVTLGIGLLIWAAPVAAAAVFLGSTHTLTTQGVFFSGTAVVTFGGAYAVLAFVAQRAAEVYGWLSPTDMVRGLALAESTPGPLIMVVQFVAFLGAYHNPGTLDPWIAGVLGSLLTTWVTFVPCFLFILLGAPYVERLRHNHTLSAALTGITAAVVGVIANLGLYFTLHTLFTETNTVTTGPLHLQIPDPTSIQPVALAITTVAAVLAFALNWTMLRILGVSVALGLAATLAGLPLT